jgi:prepilin-type N-terminal cleavage/methylation domain-containing protein
MMKQMGYLSMEKLSNDIGFTLIEILIAIVIISIASLGIASLSVSIIQQNSTDKKTTMAISLAQDKMEEIKKLGYPNVSAPNLPPENYGSIPNYSSYKRTTSIADNTPAANMKTVTVTVFWNSDARSFVVKTILAQ